MREDFETHFMTNFTLIAGTFWCLEILRLAYALVAHGAWIAIPVPTIIDGTLGTGLATFVLSKIYRVSILSNQVRGPTLFGTFTTISMGSEFQVVHYKFLWLSFLKISALGKRPIWISLPVSNQKRLESVLFDRASCALSTSGGTS